jgi:hypothetical protein
MTKQMIALAGGKPRNAGIRVPGARTAFRIWTVKSGSGKDGTRGQGMPWRGKSFLPLSPGTPNNTSGN